MGRQIWCSLTHILYPSILAQSSAYFCHNSFVYCMKCSVFDGFILYKVSVKIIRNSQFHSTHLDGVNYWLISWLELVNIIKMKSLYRPCCCLISKQRPKIQTHLTSCVLSPRTSCSVGVRGIRQESKGGPWEGLWLALISLLGRVRTWSRLSSSFARWKVTVLPPWPLPSAPKRRMYTPPRTTSLQIISDAKG